MKAANRLEAALMKAHRSDALTKQRGCCIYCLEPMPRQHATADHRVPRAAGGSKGKQNIAAACRDCNAAKAAMTEASFLRLIKSPSGSASLNILLARFRRNMWIKTHACKRRILKTVGLEYRGPRKVA